MTTVNADIDAIEAVPTPLTLESGLPIKVLRIRTLATLALLRILARGAGETLLQYVSRDTDAEEFTGALLGAVVFSVPEQPQETLEFVRLLVEPANLNTQPSNPGDFAYNQEQRDLLAAELADPSIEDMITIVEQIVHLEAPHVLALGKRLAALFPTALKAETKTDQQSQKPAPKARASSKKSSEG